LTGPAKASCRHLDAIHLAPPDRAGARPQWGGEVLFYVCAGCQRPHRHLYPWAMIDGRLAKTSILGALSAPACATCAREFRAAGRAAALGIRGRYPTLGWWRRSSQTRSSSSRAEPLLASGGMRRLAV